MKALFPSGMFFVLASSRIPYIVGHAARVLASISSLSHYLPVEKLRLHHDLRPCACRIQFRCRCCVRHHVGSIDSDAHRLLCPSQAHDEGLAISINPSCSSLYLLRNRGDLLRFPSQNRSRIGSGFGSGATPSPQVLEVLWCQSTADGLVINTSRLGCPLQVHTNFRCS